jgi:uncharacterized alkaline shock family protein YloU
MIDINFGKLKSGLLVKNVNIMVKNIMRNKKNQEFCLGQIFHEFCLGLSAYI